MAVEADRVVVALIGDTSNLDSSVKGAERNFTRAMSSIEQSASSAERQIVKSSNASAFAARNLGFQLSDIGTQLSGGQSPFLIISQQGPQVAQALQEISASGAGLGQVLRTVALPGFLSILGILGPFVAQLLAGAGAMDKKKDATRELIDAINDMVKASDAAIASGTREIQVSEAKANALLDEARATRDLTRAKLQAQISNLAAARLTEQTTGGVIPGQSIVGRGAASQEANLALLRRQLAEQEQATQRAEAAVRNTRSRAIQQRVAEQTDPRAAAQGRYNRELDRLNNLRQAGIVSDGQYESQLRRITETLQRETEATSRSAGATRTRAATSRTAVSSSREANAAAREAEKAARDQARELDQLRSRLAGVERQYDPTAAAAKDFAADLETIAEAMNKGVITPARGAELRLLALEKRMQSWLSVAQGSEDALGANQLFSGTADQIDQSAQRNAEDRIYDLANLYETLFTAGTGNLWDDFKRQGLRALSLLAAQKTFELITGKAAPSGGGGSSGLIGAIASGIGGLFGRASGGYVAPGQTVRVNEARGGVELLRMGSQGGTVIPLGRTDAARPSTAPTIISAPRFDLKGAVITRELYADMQRIADQSAASASAAMGGQVLRAVPNRLAGYQRDGT